MRTLSLFAVMALALVACSGSSQERERELLLDRVGRISVEAAFEERLPHIAALEQATFTDPSLAELRDACVRAHRMLVRAEQGQENARLMLATGAGQGGALDADTSRRVSAAIAQSTSDVEEARRLFTACDGPVRQLAERRVRRP